MVTFVPTQISTAAAANNIASVSATPTPAVLHPVLQVITQTSPILGGFDIRTLAGMSGITVIESFIKYLQNQWNFPQKGMWPVVMTLLSGIVLNVAIALYLHWDLGSAIASGAFTGVLASGYHEVTK